MIQAGGEQLRRQIHLLCNKAWNESTIPEEWSKSILVPIPKKGDLSKCTNYRTISLINHTGKILLIVLLNRLKQQLESHLSEEQAGFRKDRSTVHQILTLRLIAEKAKRHGKKHRCHNIHKLGNDKLHVKITARRISKIYRGYPEKLRFLSAFGVTRWIPN